MKFKTSVWIHPSDDITPDIFYENFFNTYEEAYNFMVVDAIHVTQKLHDIPPPENNFKSSFGKFLDVISSHNKITNANCFTSHEKLTLYFSYDTSGWMKWQIQKNEHY